MDDELVSDLSLLHEASRRLLGYFVFTWFTKYLASITWRMRTWARAGLIRGLDQPTDRARRWLFDFNQLDLEKITYLNGIYFFILAAHKSANHRLMNDRGRRRLLYLRGFDFEASLATGAGEGGEGLAAGISSPGTAAFQGRLGEEFGPSFELFKAFSPRDVWRETITAQRWFAGDYDEITHFVQGAWRSFYLSGAHWREDVCRLMGLVDHYLVHISSVTESVLWELAQLDTDERRDRVTVIFDEEAIGRNQGILAAQQAMAGEFGDFLWTKEEQPAAIGTAELRERIGRRFRLTTPDAFLDGIVAERERIAASVAPLPAGARAAWLDFRFAPALPEAELAELRGFAARLDGWIAGAQGEDGIGCLPLFLAQVQLRLFLALVFGEHDVAGRALAAYAGVMKAAHEFYTERREALSSERREHQLVLLEQHCELGRYVGFTLLSFGRSHEFGDYRAGANATFEARFAATHAAASACLARSAGSDLR